LKTIGFIDYFLSEWHANSYPAMILENCKRTGREYEVKYAWSELEKSPYDGVTTDEWCEKFGVERCGSLREIAQKSDFLFVLSPDNPENHERYIAETVKFGKPTYLDKTFAPDYAAAKRLAETIESSGTKVFSTSALRYAEELIALRASGNSVTEVITAGPGAYGNYAVHQFEMIVALLGRGAERLKAVSNGLGRVLAVEYGEGKQAIFNQIEAPGMPFQIAAICGGANKFSTVTSSFFDMLIEKILHMFDGGAPDVPMSETLEVAKLIDAGKAALENPGNWINLE